MADDEYCCSTQEVTPEAEQAPPKASPDTLPEDEVIESTLPVGNPTEQPESPPLPARSASHICCHCKKTILGTIFWYNKGRRIASFCSGLCIDNEILITAETPEELSKYRGIAVKRTPPNVPKKPIFVYSKNQEM